MLPLLFLRAARVALVVVSVVVSGLARRPRARRCDARGPVRPDGRRAVEPAGQTRDFQKRASHASDDDGDDDGRTWESRA